LAFTDFGLMQYRRSGRRSAPAQAGRRESNPGLPGEPEAPPNGEVSTRIQHTKAGNTSFSFILFDFFRVIPSRNIVCAVMQYGRPAK
jgi:hypothetical protein